jgi:hypothetical protein
MSADVCLSPEEIFEITRYKQPCRQVDELRRQGYYRARRAPVTGEVIVERAHYEAVNQGLMAPANDHKARPKVRA